MEKQFILEGWSSSALTGISSAYIVEVSTDTAVDTYYWDPQSQEGWTHSGVSPLDYGIE